MLAGHWSASVASAIGALAFTHVASSAALDSPPPGSQTAAVSVESASSDFFRTPADLRRARHLFERETFGGNGRTCLTCHSRSTGTVSPEDAQRRFAKDPNDPLFVADGSDDGEGNGASRMLRDATILVRIPAFKIPSLWGVARTAPYFHDNSSKTLQDVMRHYARFFGAISPVVLTEQDQKDVIAYMQLLR